MEDNRKELKTSGRAPEMAPPRGRSRKKSASAGVPKRTAAEVPTGSAPNAEAEAAAGSAPGTAVGAPLGGGAASSRGGSGKKIPAVGMIAIAVILAAGLGGGYYLSQASLYREAFLPNTTINGMDASKMTVDEVKAAIERELSGYELTVLERTGLAEKITKDDIGLHSEFDGSLEEILAAQEPMKWITALRNPTEYEISTMIAYDEAKLQARVEALQCMDGSTMVFPEDAKLSEYQSATKSYEIVPAVQGTELVPELVLEAVTDAVINMQDEVDLDAVSCYTKPDVETDDEALTALAAKLNQYVGAVVNHTFGNAQETLDGDTIHQWLTVHGTDVTLDESQVPAYIRALAKKYNTAYGKKQLKTSYGKTVTISGGHYGWRMDEKAEAAATLAVIKEGSQQTREPEWIQKAASHGDTDYGDTYVEVNLTAQHLFFYKNGKLMVEADFVSGNQSKGWSTPTGSYALTYKERNATLRGEDYATPVSYWMPFNGNIGLHDADWRTSFGGTLYKTGGSHGCVNLPPKAAKIIYENIEKGDPILCYELLGTESKRTTKPSDINTSGAAAATTGAQETTAAPTTAPTEATAAPTEPSAAPGQPGTGPSVQVDPTVPETAPAAGQTPGGNAGPGGSSAGGSGTTTPNGNTTAPGGSAGPGSQGGNGLQPETSAPAGGQSGPGESSAGNTAGGPGGSSTGSTANGPGGSSAGNTPGGPGSSSSSSTANGPGGSSSGTSGNVAAGPGAAGNENLGGGPGGVSAGPGAYQP